jgi:hypothetical protein
MVHIPIERERERERERDRERGMVVVVLKTVQTGKYTYTTPTNIWATLSRVIIHLNPKP